MKPGVQSSTLRHPSPEEVIYPTVRAGLFSGVAPPGSAWGLTVAGEAHVETVGTPVPLQPLEP